MRNSVYAILIAVAAFSSGVWWARHHDDRAAVGTAVSQRAATGPEVVRSDERSKTTHSPSGVKVSRAALLESTRTPERASQTESPAAVVVVRRTDAPPIDVSPGFETVLAPASDVATDRDNPAGIPVRQHLKLQAEIRDAGWSDRVESEIRAQVRSELMARGADPQRIELSVVECRTSGCEIQALGYPEDTGKGRDLQGILPKLMRDQMAADFDAKGLTMMVTSVPDGRMGFIAFLSRKKP